MAVFIFDITQGQNRSKGFLFLLHYLNIILKFIFNAFHNITYLYVPT